MAISFVQQIAGSADNTGSLNSSPFNTTTGTALFIVVASTNQNENFSLSDNYGNSFTALPKMQQASNGTSRLFYNLNINGGANHIININGNTPYGVAYIINNFSGMANGELDRAAQFVNTAITSNSNTISTGSATQMNNELIIGYGNVDRTQTGVVSGDGSYTNFRAEDTAASGIPYPVSAYIQTRIVSAKGTYQHRVENIDVASNRWNNAIATFTDSPIATPAEATAQAATDVNKTSATSNGTVTVTGTATVTKRGFVYGTTSQALPGAILPGSTGYAAYVEENGTFNVGSFMANLTNLAKNTTYYYRAYAYSSLGYRYSPQEISFTTLPGEPLIDAFSASNGGFTDITDSNDTDPFDSGDQISYTPNKALVGAPVANTYYFDGSDASSYDANNVWTNEANATNGSTANYAYANNSGSTSNNFLHLQGTNAPIIGGAVTQVRARLYADAIAISMGATIYTNSLAESLGSISGNGITTGWGAWTTLSVPTGGWDWGKVATLEAKAYANDAAGLSRIEIEVTSYPLSPTTFYGYFDGHSGITDPSNYWNSDSNAFDGNFDPGFMGATAASMGVGSYVEGTKNSGYLQGIGTNYSGTGQIILVRVRTMSGFDTAGIQSFATIYSSAQELGTASTLSGSPGSFGNWTVLQTPSGGWTSAKVAELTARIYGTDTGDLYASRNAGVQLEVSTLQPLPGGTYYWKVRVKDPAGSDSWSDWTTPRSFTLTDKQTLTKTHATSANKRKAGTKTHTTNALKRSQGLRTHSTSAFRYRIGTKSHTTTAFKRKALTRTHTTSAVVRRVANYSRQGLAALPTTNNDLTTAFNSTEYSNVSTDNSVYVNQLGTPYAVFHFKYEHINEEDAISIKWNGRTDIAPSEKPVTMQIWNYSISQWVTVATNDSAAANTDFNLTTTINTDVANYYEDNIVSVRVYQ